MTEEFAKRYAAALLKGNDGKGDFEVSTPESMDLELVAKALEGFGCVVERGEFKDFLTVRVPQPINIDHQAFSTSSVSA